MTESGLCHVRSPLEANLDVSPKNDAEVQIITGHPIQLRP